LKEEAKLKSDHVSYASRQRIILNAKIKELYHREELMYTEIAVVKLNNRINGRLKDNFMRVVICEMIYIVSCKCIKGIGVIEVYR